MTTTLKGKLSLSSGKIAIVTARFNDFVTSRLNAGAKEALELHGFQMKDIVDVTVPGAFEIPLTCQKLAETKKYDAIICLGAVIRGATPHFDYVCSESAKGISQVSLKYGLPIINGILTTDSLEQAIDRAGAKSGNKGFDAALAAIEMITLFQEIK